MRTPINTFNPLMFFWSIVYVLALLSIYSVIAGILARSREATPAKNQSEASAGLDPEANLSVINLLKS